MLTTEETTLWVVALVVGAVVVLAVVALLTLLLLFLRDIASGASSLVELTRRLPAETEATEVVEGDGTITSQLETTASVVEEIREEVLLHRDLLPGPRAAYPAKKQDAAP